MIELLQNRDYNKKIFLHDTEVGRRIMHAHTGHIHYKDNGEFKEIDWTLLFDEIKRGWYFNTHSFHPFLPEYSDGIVEFNDLFQDKNQTVKYKAVCDKVKGELIATDETNPNFDDNPNNKGVLYKDAFGAGKDYLLYHTRSSLVKVATINNPNEQTSDVKFRWEIEFPNKKIYRAENKKNVEKIERENLSDLIDNNRNKAYKLDTTKNKKFDTNKQILIGDTLLDDKEWFTYLRSFRAWDSKGKLIIVGTEIINKNGKLYLEKTIPLSFLQNAEGRVFTDTTTSYYSGSGDGWVGRNPASLVSFSDLRDGDGTEYENGADQAYVALYGSTTSNLYDALRISALFPDTSGLGSSASISSATLYIKGLGGLNQLGGLEIHVGGINPASTSTLAASDFQTRQHTSFGYISFSSWSTSAYNAISLNSSGLSAISKTGITKLSVQTGHDINNSAPTWSSGNSNLVYFYFSEATGTSSDPYIEITYTIETPKSKAYIIH